MRSSTRWRRSRLRPAARESRARWGSPAVRRRSGRSWSRTGRPKGAGRRTPHRACPIRLGRGAIDYRMALRTPARMPAPITHARPIQNHSIWPVMKLPLTYPSPWPIHTRPTRRRSAAKTRTPDFIRCSYAARLRGIYPTNSEAAPRVRGACRHRLEPADPFFDRWVGAEQVPDRLAREWIDDVEVGECRRCGLRRDHLSRPLELPQRRCKRHRITRDLGAGVIRLVLA